MTAAPVDTLRHERRWRSGLFGSVEFGQSARDEMWWLTALSVGGLVVAGLLAAIGGYPFDTPMPTHAVGWVEPSCGLTRGSTAIARGDLAVAWRYNPASFVVIGLGVVGVLRILVGLATRRWVWLSVRPSRLGWATLLICFLGFWAYQQANAEFIIDARI